MVNEKVRAIRTDGRTDCTDRTDQGVPKLIISTI